MSVIIHNRHDNFFKLAMKNLKVATEFLQHHLPANLQAQLELTTLELQPGTYVNKALESSASDVLFKVNYKKKSGFAYVYVLLEQQSSVEHMMAFRLLDYMTSIWKELIAKDIEKSRNKSYRLPLIVPLVFYSGPEKYRGATDIRDLIAAPRDLIEAFLFTPFHLIDLHDISDEEIKAKKWLGVVEFAMRHIYERETLNYIQPLLELIQFVCREGLTDLGEGVLKYVLSQAKTEYPERLAEVLKTGLSEGNIMGMFVDYVIEQNKGAWVQAGVEQGIEQGIEQGVQLGEGTLLIRLLECKFKKTLPECYRQQIDQASPEILLELAERVLTSQSLDEVFSG